MKVETPADATFSICRIQAAANFSTPYEIAGKPLLEWIPAEWFSIIDSSSVWIRSYLVAGSYLAEPGCLPLRTAGLVVLLFRGPIRWVEATNSRKTADVTADVNITERELAEATYAALITPFSIDGAPGNEASTRQQLDAMAGLLAVLTSPNIIYERIFDVIAHLGVNRLTAHTPPFRNPAWFDPPITDVQPLEQFVNISSDLASRPIDVRDKARLSLRWYEAALKEENGPDAIIKHWVALETLTMPETNIKPLVETVAVAYGWSIEKTQRRFMIGQLFGLRSLIVHAGARVVVDSNLLSFMAALYEDALLTTLGQPCQRRAENFLVARPAFDLGRCLAAVHSGTLADDAKVLAKFP